MTLIQDLGVILAEYLVLFGICRSPGSSEHIAYVAEQNSKKASQFTPKINVLGDTGTTYWKVSLL